MYKIAWLPGDGVGVDVLEAAKIVLDKLDLDAEYIYGDIGWDFWCKEGNALPQRTIDILKNVDAAMFGAITSKPIKEAEAELSPDLKDKGFVELEEKTAPTGWGSATFSMSRLERNGTGVLIVRLPHLSYYKIFSREQCKSAIDQFSSQIAQAVGNVNL